ncbi:MAG: hypothetical protein M5U28_10335 [Sandaracinaceae bacterium]|nr:hypothetical protein [Sandaracinaceae bacterium]
MRVRVRSSWRTRALLLVAILAAGLIAWLETERRARERPPRERASYEVEVELSD